MYPLAFYAIKCRAYDIFEHLYATYKLDFTTQLKRTSPLAGGVKPPLPEEWLSGSSTMHHVSE